LFIINRKYNLNLIKVFSIEYGAFQKILKINAFFTNDGKMTVDFKLIMDKVLRLLFNNNEKIMDK
jgi:hypothetical protein